MPGIVHQRLIDLSHVISADTPAFPGDPPVDIEIMDSIDGKTDGRQHLNCTRLAMSVHCGTHMDAPFHFFSDAAPIDQVALEVVIGEAVCVPLPDHGEGGTIERAHFEPWNSVVSNTSRVVLNTGWYHKWRSDHYFTQHPVLSRDAAQWLVDAGVKLVGVDFPSVDRPPHEAHHVLLGQGVVIVENMTNLDALPCRQFQLIATPLKILGRDGSPVRAVATQFRTS